MPLTPRKQSFIFITIENIKKYHDIHVRKITIDNKTEAYIQSIVLKKTLEAISFDYRRHNMLKGIRREVAVVEALEETAKSLELCDGMSTLIAKEKYGYFIFPN